MSFHEVISIREETKKRLDSYRKNFLKENGLRRISRSEIIERLLTLVENMEEVNE